MQVRGVRPDGPAEVVGVKWYGTSASSGGEAGQDSVQHAAAAGEPAIVTTQEEFAALLVVPEGARLEFKAARGSFHFEDLVKYVVALPDPPRQTRSISEAKQSRVITATLFRISTYMLHVFGHVQASPQSPVELSAMRLTGSDALAVRASRKLKNDELLIVEFAPTMLRKAMDDIPLWRGDHVAVRQLIEDFAKYLYLPRLRGPEVLVGAVQEGVGRLTWGSETFALADSWDDKKAAYLGLRAGQTARVSADSGGVLVKPDVAAAQLDRERNPERPPLEPGEGEPGRPVSPVPPVPEPPRRLMRRFHGSVSLDPDRLGRAAGRIAEEIVQHLTTQKNATVHLTLEIDADFPEGAPDTIVRVVTENARTLKFKSQGFEKE